MKENLPKRKNIRLRYYDYSEEGLYFITICTKNREHIIRNKNEYYKIKQCIQSNIAN